MKTAEEVLEKHRQYLAGVEVVYFDAAIKAMKDYANEQVIIALAKSGNDLKSKLEHNAKGWLECADEKTKMKEENERLTKEIAELKKLMIW